VKKGKIRKLLFFALVIFSLMSSVFGRMDEGQQAEKDGAEAKNQLLALPIVYYTPETKIAGGFGGIYYLRSLKDNLKGHPSTFFMDMIYTQEEQFILEFIPDFYLDSGKRHLVGYLGFKDYFEKFYGIGSQTTEKMEEGFGYKNFRLKCSLRSRFSGVFYVGVQYDFEYSEITETDPGGMLDSGDILGEEGGVLSGLGILLVQDNRDNIFFPTRGALLQGAAMVFSPALRSDYNFRYFTLDFRQYVTVFSSHVLALRQSLQSASGGVPFQRLPMLGGPNAMRGYVKGRFRDKNAVFLQMEYRLPLIWRLFAVGFVGYGGVADKMTSFNLDDFKVAGGLGIRYRINRKSGTNVRLDFGFAQGNLSVYAMINESF
jgi:outer membrane protein assembly factor BamA